MSVRILIGDMRQRLRDLPDASVDSCVCDPPYHLTSIVKRFGKPNSAPINNRDEKEGRNGPYHRASKGFMGQTWDGGDVAFDPETWAEVLRVLKPGGHLVAFSGTRTYHRMAVAIEDAGFEIRDQLAWVYGSGFPKSLDVSKQIDKAAGAERTEVISSYKATGTARTMTGGNYGGGGNNVEERDEIVKMAPVTDAAREWQGWGTALKPSWEPICLARKPLDGTVAGNVLMHGTGAINIDGCRIGTEGARNNGRQAGTKGIYGHIGATERVDYGMGRWPANLCQDGSDEVLAGFPETAPSPSGLITQGGDHFSIGSKAKTRGTKFQGHGDEGSAARFFLEAKYSEDELLFRRAKAKLSAWSLELANTAEEGSSLSNPHAVFALRLAAIAALPEGRRLSALTGLSTSATPSELRRLATSFTAAILSIESGCSPAWLQEKHTPSDSPVQLAETPRPTDTITITISHWKSSGCAEPVTFSITPLNSEPGAKDLAPARFKYGAKATTEERGEGNNHPTVKPQALMRWLVRLVTPVGGTVLDPFAGSGSTLIAADAEQFNAIGCELSPDYAEIARKRIAAAAGMFADISVERTGPSSQAAA